jgi:Flp pilus assembly protein TadD
MMPEDALSAAARLHRSGNTPAAIAACRPAADDGHPPAMRLLALLLAEVGSLDQARDLIGRTAAADRSPETLTAQGRILAMSRQFGAAAKVLREVLAVEPGSIPARQLLSHVENALPRLIDEAKVHFRNRNFHAAVEMFRETVAIRPGDPLLLHDLGTAMVEAGDAAHAVVAYRAALVNAPDRVETWHNLGSAFQAIGDIDAAIDAYAQAYARDPASFPRIAQELAAGRAGQVWLTAAALKTRLRRSAGRSSASVPGTDCDKRPAHAEPHHPPR